MDRLCAVWVSHKHADHMLGLPGILSARSADQPPLLASPSPTLLCHVTVAALLLGRALPQKACQTAALNDSLFVRV